MLIECLSGKQEALEVPTWGLHSAVMVWVDADLLLLGTKWELTAFQRLQFMVALEVGPAPHTAINDMR